MYESIEDYIDTYLDNSGITIPNGIYIHYVNTISDMLIDTLFMVDDLS